MPAKKMESGIAIADGLVLPLDAVTQTFAAIGRKGAGKTYLATMIAEQMLDADAQVVALDPVGNWWGLRVDADGRSKGKELFVLGGEHGDVPLTPEAGARIARFLVEKRVSAVLDVSAFRQGERKRFAADFGEELFHLKKGARTPVHLFVEEAQLFAPQRAGPDEARMLGAYENIIRLGRNYGVGATLVTQRPQSVNKEVLSQVECLCVLQVNGTHERKALTEWVQEAGADRELVGHLPGLGRGEGYVWSPSWLRLFRRVRFRKKTTFDASATPEVGKEARAASVAAVDVEALRADLAEVVASAEKDDPKALRRRIQELERELRAKPAAVSVEPKVVEVPVLKPEQWNAIEEGISDIQAALGDATRGMQDFRREFTKAHAILLGPPTARTSAPSATYKRVETTRAVYPGTGAARVPTTAMARQTSDAALGAGERKVLTAIAQHGEGVTREQLTVLTGYKRSSRDTYLQRLGARGLTEQRGETILATDAGVAALGSDFEPLPTGDVLREHWLRDLSGGERKVLEYLCEQHPNPVARETLSVATGYRRSSRDTYLQRLISRRLVEAVDRGEVRAADMLFG